MSDIGAKVAELIAAGCAPEVAARVVAETFVAGHQSTEFRVTERDVTRDERDERRRELARLRQQRKREMSRVTVTPIEQNQIVDGVTVTRDEKLPLSKEEKKEDKISEREAQPSRRHAASRGQRLPDDWVPTPQDIATADELLGSPERRRAELEKFRDHWKQQPGGKGVKLDWDAAWRNWIRRAAEYRGGMNGHRAHNANGRPAGGTFFDGLRSLAEDIARDGEPPRPADPEIPRGRIEIDG